MKRIRPHLLAVLTLASLPISLGQARTIPVDGYAAAVENQIITVADVIAVMQPIERQLRQTFQGDELTRKLEETFDKTLDSLIERALVVEDFKRRKELQLPDTVVNSRMDEIIRNRFARSRADFLKALNNEGLTIDEWKTNLKNSMIVSLMREREVDSRISITPGSVRQAYENDLDTYRVPEKIELHMIMIRAAGTPEEIGIKKKLATDTRQRILNGESFEAVAKQVTEDPAKTENGGYYGWVEPSDRRQELADALSTLKPNQVSDLIQAGDDLYILQISGRQNASVTPFENVQDAIRKNLMQKESKRLYEDWIRRLKQNAYVHKF